MKWLLVLLAMVFVSSAANAAEDSTVCKNFYHAVTAEAQSIIRDDTRDFEQKQKDLAVVFNKTVDSKWIGKFVLGRFWRVATPAEQKEYLDLYQQYLTQIYVSKFNDEDLSSFELVMTSMTRLASGEIATKTLIKRPGQQEVHVDYTMTEVGNECRVRDIVIENVSLLSSQRSEFGSLASRSGVAGVIEAMKRQLLS